jgi:hypothetical protein
MTDRMKYEPEEYGMKLPWPNLRYPGTVIPRFMSFIHFYKTVRKAKTHKTKINFPLLPDGNNDQFARGRSSY